MDNLDNQTANQPNTNDLQDQCDALRHLVVSVLILVIVISGTFNIYLLRQWRTASKDLAAIRPQATQMIAEYQKVSAPLMSDFVKKITEYGRTHPDFAPILAKYGIKPTATTSSVPGILTPERPAAPAKK